MDDAKKKRPGFILPPELDHDDDDEPGCWIPDDHGDVYLKRKQPQPEKPKRRDGSQRPRP